MKPIRLKLCFQQILIIPRNFYIFHFEAKKNFPIKYNDSIPTKNKKPPKINLGWFQYLKFEKSSFR